MATSHMLLQTSGSPSVSSAKTHRPTFHALESCSTMAELKQFHSQMIRLGLSADNDAMGRIVKFSAISEFGDLNYAQKVFDGIPQPDAFIYNTIIRGYLQAQLTRNCIQLYCQMLQASVIPNQFTFPPVVRSCCVHNAVEEGKQVHAHILKFGFLEDSFSQNNLIHMYVNFHRLEEAQRVFDKMPRRDIVSWTTLISGFSQLGFVDDAYKIFEQMPEKHSVSWNAMIAAYVQSNRFNEAFALFERMQAEKVELDKFVAASMLSACTGFGALEQGEWIHQFIKSRGIELDPKLATTIIDMYCKCGCLEKAFEVFNGLSNKSISSWNCMIGGLAMHGKGNAAIKLFKEMERKNLVPDNITFLNILSACAHAGLVEEGRHYFHYMTEVYGLEPKMEHFGCMVDLLGRAGLLQEAKKLIDEMPVSPDAGVLGALLGACKIHGEIDLGEEIGKQVIELETHNSGRYVLLANLYANVGRWDDVASIRKLMNDRGVKKVPGISMIELEGAVNEFIAGGRTHPHAKQIYAKVDEMLESIRSAGYVPDIEGVLHDIDEEEKENPLYYHSEKLAIAYGFLKTKPGATIRVSKNLRVCKDCHQASKLISKVFNREIVVRDRNRFHHFRNGECSCNDYW
ncbi:pentatricopeptide repeat-containing protein At5g66520-like [Macadamia integrifolia]|uniref:pentatricopeptide repeat-containing protein At5g66520-like n=1 Tax=Macadamia integrifolia TaxID=60698 RepID=UPI001C4E4025|nr:pentatricopeptide repeat-containing protein At5g66520-like [Macadamia integrifolia]